MQQSSGATHPSIERRTARPSAVADGRTSSTPGGLAGIEMGLLALVYAVSVGSLVGFATFGLHPAMLARAQVSAETYARMLTWAPRAQILIAALALAAVLVRRVGGRWLAAFGAVYLVSLLAELAGTTVGLPFGPYRYTDGLGIKWFAHVPALIPVSWFMMALPSYAIAMRRFTRGGDGWLRIALGSFILLSWDLALDPAMSFATRYWIWGTAGPYYGMPILNLAGWFVTGVALMVVFSVLHVERWLGDVPSSWLMAFYAANLLLPVGMSVAVGLWGVVIATGVAFAIAFAIARGMNRASFA